MRVYLFVPFDEAGKVEMTTGVRPWMVAIILARELLVTSIRGVFEGLGIDFSAGSSGKWKMVLQSVAAPFALFVAVNPFALESVAFVAVSRHPDLADDPHHRLVGLALPAPVPLNSVGGQTPPDDAGSDA